MPQLHIMQKKMPGNLSLFQGVPSNVVIAETSHVKLLHHCKILLKVDYSPFSNSAY